jgi:hypothetical protein
MNYFKKHLPELEDVVTSVLLVVVDVFVVSL